MAHAHSVYDSDNHFSINPTTRVIVNESSTKNTVVQNDHNSERFTFELPRYIEGHDMSVCDRVEVHYLNIEAVSQAISSGVYEVDDLQVSPVDNKVVICSWLISNNATKYEGKTSFLIRFACTTDGDFDYVWNTAVYSDITVSKGIYNSGVVIENYADILAQWHRDLFEEGGNAVVNIKDAEATAIDALKNAANAKEQEVLNNIPDDYQTLDANVTEYKKKVDGLANAIKGKMSGSVVRADDVSPIEHSIDVRVRSKNLCLTNEITVSGAHPWANKFLDETITLTKGVYTISADFAQTGTKSFVSVSVRETDKTTQLFVKSSNEMNGKLFGTFEIAENIKDVRVVFYSNLTESVYDTSCAFTNIQIELGTTPTEYTPYVDPASVTVTKCGENLITPPYAHSSGYTSNGVTFTVEEDGTVVINGTASATTEFLFERALKLPIGTYSYRLFGVEKSPDMCSGVVNQYNGEVWQKGLGSDRGNGVTFEITEADAETVIRTNVYILLSGKTFTDFRVSPMLCVGSVADKYEPYNGITHTPTTDGTILDMTSLSPTMTLLTDTEGAIVECEYNRDSNAVIADLYNKIAELSATT